MYSRKSTFNQYAYPAPRRTSYSRQQYATPAHNGPRLCNQCQAPLECSQLAYCSKCCYCKCCNSRRISDEEMDLAINAPALPLSATLAGIGSSPSTVASAKELEDLQALTERSERELDAALEHLAMSQDKLKKTLESRVTEKAKLKRTSATVGLTDREDTPKKLVTDFLKAAPVLKLDAPALAKEMNARPKRQRKGKEPAESKEPDTDLDE